MKIIPLLATCLLLSAWAGLAGTDYRVIEHQEEDGVGTFTVLIPASQFNKESLVNLAKQFLRVYARFSLLDVGIYTDPASVHEFVGAGVTDYTYGIWLREFEARRKRRLPCGAEILKSGTAAGLRIRYYDGRIDEVTIRGRDVFHPVIKGITLDLLHVRCVRQGWGTQARLTPLLYFAVLKNITPREGGAIARSILASSGVPRMSISMRPDGWFMLDPYYPWLNPFRPVDSPPTEEAKAAWQLLCHPADEQVCSQVHGR